MQPVTIHMRHTTGVRRMRPLSGPADRTRTARQHSRELRAARIAKGARA